MNRALRCRNEVVDEKLAEKTRYDGRADSVREAVQAGAVSGVSSVPLYLRGPYLAYEIAVGQVAKPGVAVLEIGSGSGEFTDVALRTGAQVIATDISERCLSVIPVRYPHAVDRLSVCQADMEALPFPDGVFDLVISAGSLSYGDNDTVIREIHRVLSSGGAFICVDSLNHNPIYKLNRFLHRLRGERTASTLRRMPTIGLTEKYARCFGSISVRYFGSASWMMPFISRLLSVDTATKLSDRIDRLVGVKRSAFKFVMVATKIGD
jgi:ubiquinone/menaquinone biosynthesis C-methylase UbiE